MLEGRMDPKQWHGNMVSDEFALRLPLESCYRKCQGQILQWQTQLRGLSFQDLLQVRNIVIQSMRNLRILERAGEKTSNV